MQDMFAQQKVQARRLSLQADSGLHQDILHQFLVSQGPIYLPIVLNKTNAYQLQQVIMRICSVRLHKHLVPTAVIVVVQIRLRA